MLEREVEDAADAELERLGVEAGGIEMDVLERSGEIARDGRLGGVQRVPLTPLSDPDFPEGMRWGRWWWCWIRKHCTSAFPFTFTGHLSFGLLKISL